MGCECYKIGGPFIDVDPNCATHRKGGLRDQEEAREVLEERVRKLEEKVAILWEQRS
jgi:hypothetical protein